MFSILPFAQFGTSERGGEIIGKKRKKNPNRSKYSVAWGFVEEKEMQAPRDSVTLPSLAKKKGEMSGGGGSTTNFKSHDEPPLPTHKHEYFHRSNPNTQYVYSNSRASTVRRNQNLVEEAAAAVNDETNYDNYATTPSRSEGKETLMERTNFSDTSPLETPHDANEDPSVEMGAKEYIGMRSSPSQTPLSSTRGLRGGGGPAVFDRLAKPTLTMQRALAAVSMLPPTCTTKQDAFSSAGHSSSYSPIRPRGRGMGQRDLRGNKTGADRPVPLALTPRTPQAPKRREVLGDAFDGQLHVMLSRTARVHDAHTAEPRTVSTAPSGAKRPSRVSSLPSQGPSPMLVAGPSRAIPTAFSPAEPMALPLTDEQIEAGLAKAQVNKRTSSQNTALRAPSKERGVEAVKNTCADEESSTSPAPSPTITCVPPEPLEPSSLLATTATQAMSGTHSGDTSLPFSPTPPMSTLNTPARQKTISSGPPSPRTPQNKFFQNYHAMLVATKAENEAARLEAKGLARTGTLEGVLNQEKALWIRSNYAVLNKGILPITCALPTATVSATGNFPTSAVQYANAAVLANASVDNGSGGVVVGNTHSSKNARGGSRIRMSISEPTPSGPPIDALTAQWEKSEVLVVMCNQMLVRHLQSLSTDHMSLVNELVAVCERVMWTPHQMLLCDGPPTDSPTTAPQLLSQGPMAGSDPFVGNPALRTYLLGCTLTNYAAVQRLSREPLQNIVATLDRALQLQELNYSCQTLFNLAAVLVEAHRFLEALEAAELCIDLANHHLTAPFLESERQSLAFEAFVTETATLCVLAHHLIVAVASWSGSLEVAAYHAQLAMGCSTSFLGTAHALTTRSAQRLDAISKKVKEEATSKEEAEVETSLRMTGTVVSQSVASLTTLSPDRATGADEFTPPLIPMQMAVFGSNVRPSAILSFAVCYPLSPYLLRRLNELKGLRSDGGMGSLREKGMSSVRRFGAQALGGNRGKARMAFTRHFSNVLTEQLTGLPAISTASIAGSPTPAYLALMRAREGHFSREGEGPLGSEGRLLLIRPAPKGTVLMPPLAPKYRSLTDYETANVLTTSTQPHPQGSPLSQRHLLRVSKSSGGGKNRFLVAQMDRSNMATPISTRAPTPNATPLLSIDSPGATAFPSSASSVFLFGSPQSPAPPKSTAPAATSSVRHVPSSNPTMVGVTRKPLYEASVGGGAIGAGTALVARRTSVSFVADTGTKVSLPPRSDERLFGGSVLLPPPRFQSLRSRSPSAFETSGCDFHTAVVAAEVPSPKPFGAGGATVIAEDGSLLPGFTLEHPRGSIVLSDRHVLVPQPPAPRTAKCVSVVPLRDYELYKSLQAEVEHYLAPRGSSQTHDSIVNSTLGLANDPATPASATKRPAWHRASIVGTTAPRSHSHALLKRSDAELRELSHVIPDHTPTDEARWESAARVLQIFYNIIVAKKELALRKASAALWREYSIAGEAISNAYREHKERKPAVEEKKKRLRHAQSVAAASLVKAVFRQWQSTEKAAGRLIAVREEQRVANEQRRLEELSAITIQSIYRRHAAKLLVTKLTGAARTIQRWRRWYLAYGQVRILVYAKRRKAREVLAFHTSKALIIQRWWRHELSMILAIRELGRRKRAMSHFMDDYLEKDKHYWALFKDVDEEQCVLLIGRVGRAYTERRGFGQWGARFRKETKAAKILQRFIRYGIAKNIQNNRRGEKNRIQHEKRSREERQEAARDIQRTVRAFLAKKKCDRIRAENALRLHAAIVIQNLFRRAIRRNVIKALLDADRWDRMLYLRAEARRHAATTIQSCWRMHRTKQFVAQYRHFKRVVEPHCANILQRAVRCFLARCHYRDRLVEVESMIRVAQQKEFERACAVRIQSTWRMYSVIKQVYYGEVDATKTVLGSNSKSGALVGLKPARRTNTRKVFAQRRAAATAIQTLWRRVAAKAFVNQQRLILQHRDHALVTQENLHAYATKIQSVVRMAILNKKYVTAAVIRHEGWAISRIQRVGRRFLERRCNWREAERAARNAWESSRVIAQVRKEAHRPADVEGAEVTARRLLLSEQPKRSADGRLSTGFCDAVSNKRQLEAANERATPSVAALASEMLEMRITAGLQITRWAKCCLAVRLRARLIVERDAFVTALQEAEEEAAARTVQKWWQVRQAQPKCPKDYSETGLVLPPLNEADQTNDELKRK